MHNLRKAMHNLNRSLDEQDQRPTIPFEEFVKLLLSDPKKVIRNVFQVFHDMFKASVGEGEDEYPNDPESIHYKNYDCTNLFVEGSDHPFFADRLFANRLVNLVESLRLGAQQNKIYIFEGPHGSGKSTFFNNLLQRFEEYANTEDGLRYEVVWRLSKKTLGDLASHGMHPLLEKLAQALNVPAEEHQETDSHHHHHHEPRVSAGGEFVEIPCPSHDNPILVVPKHYRRQFFDDIFANDRFKWKLFTEKEYEWVFHDMPCTICTSLYEALLGRVKNPLRVFGRLYARPYRFNRRLGEGISVFNPGDPPLKQDVLSNDILQRSVNQYLHDSNQVRYIFSRYAKTNNGIYALMDIKQHNRERLIELHNIISEGVHKVEEIEERVNSLLFALMNPEDKKNIEDIQSFLDRIEYINVPYVLDVNTEILIYRNVFGRHIDERFLPGVLQNFARVIIASRMNSKSAAMAEWIQEQGKYKRFCDSNFLLLKMEIYSGIIPSWLSDEDRKRLNALRRRRIIAESDSEGQSGFSGRDSIKIFNDFFSAYARENSLVTMVMVCKFFNKLIGQKKDVVPTGFLDSLLNMYDYRVLQEVKESLYYYNEEQILVDIQNYIHAVNFDIGAKVTCTYTGESFTVSEDFLKSIESRLLGGQGGNKLFRNEVQREYVTTALTQEILRDGLPIVKTKLFKALYERYVYNLKEKVLDPFSENDNFRNAIKDFNEEQFKTYDKKIRDDVTFLIDNLCTKYNYTQLGAKEVCIYVIDSDLAKKFT